jgi:hypothetical protein
MGQRAPVALAGEHNRRLPQDHPPAALPQPGGRGRSDRGGDGAPVGALPAGQPYCFSDRRKELRHATSLHGLLPEALQYLLPTKADWLEEFGMVLRCEKWGGER